MDKEKCYWNLWLAELELFIAHKGFKLEHR